MPNTGPAWNIWVTPYLSKIVRGEVHPRVTSDSILNQSGNAVRNHDFVIVGSIMFNPLMFNPLIDSMNSLYHWPIPKLRGTGIFTYCILLPCGFSFNVGQYSSLCRSVWDILGYAVVSHGSRIPTGWTWCQSFAIWWTDLPTILPTVRSSGCGSTRGELGWPLKMNRINHWGGQPRRL